jgi:S1-C subfamily serine protease
MESERAPGRRWMAPARAVAVGLLAVMVLADAAFAAAIVLTREPAPRPLTGNRILRASSPAVVLVQAEYTVSTSVPDSEISAAKNSELVNQIVARLRSGQLANDPAAIDQAALDLIVANPDEYVTPTAKRITGSYSLVNSGSGFFVTQDGYLVTASHVVSATNDDIRAEILDLEMQPDSVAAARADLKKSIETGTGLTASDVQLDKLSAWLQAWDTKYLSLDKIEARYYLGGGSSVEAGTRLEATGVRASLVKQEPVYPDRDVALLKADVSPVPALRLAGKDPAPGSADFVVGYPRVGYLQETAPFDASIPIVLASGHTNSTIPRSDWTAYGTGASGVTHGNSGGPVLDSTGSVVGMLSFGSSDDSYLVPVSVVGALLAKAGAKPAPGSLTPLYYRALQEGDVKHYRHELPLLSALQVKLPSDAYLKEDLSAAQTAILAGEDRTPINVLPWEQDVIAASAIVLLINLALLVFGSLSVRRRKAAASPPGAEPAAQPEYAFAESVSESEDSAEAPRIHGPG